MKKITQSFFATNNQQELNDMTQPERTHGTDGEQLVSGREQRFVRVCEL